MLPSNFIHTHLRMQENWKVQNLYYLSKQSTFQTLLKQKQTKLWKPRYVAVDGPWEAATAILQHILSLTDKASNTNKKPFKINSTRNADVLKKASDVIAAKF